MEEGICTRMACVDGADGGGGSGGRGPSLPPQPRPGVPGGGVYRFIVSPGRSVFVTAQLATDESFSGSWQHKRRRLMMLLFIIIIIIIIIPICSTKTTCCVDIDGIDR